MRLHISIGILLLTLTYSQSFGAEASPTPTLTSGDIEEILPSEPKAKPLEQALRAMHSKNFAQVRLAAAKLTKFKPLGDLGLALQSLSYRSEAQEALKLKSGQQALAAAKKAYSPLIMIQSDYPYSPLAKKIGEEFAQLELIESRALSLLKRPSEAREKSERAFHRLAQSSLLGTLRPEHLSNYSDLCVPKPTDSCKLWEPKLVQSTSRASPERKALKKLEDLEKGEQKKPEAFTRTTQPYKAPDLDQAAFDAAFQFVTDRKWSEAIEAFKKFADEYPRSTYRFRARYWYAKALKENHQDDKAKAEFSSLTQDSPLTYYGLLASVEAGLAPERFLKSEGLPSADDLSEAITEETLLPHEAIHLKRAELILGSLDTESSDVTDLASQELKAIRPRDGLSSLALLYLVGLNHLAGNHPTAFSHATELFQRGDTRLLSPFGVEVIFPTDHFQQISKIAGETSLDPILATSLIKQESGFDEKAISSSGALGLMQLMPFTALDVDSQVLRAELTDPDRNVRVGTQYLKRLLKKFNSNIAFSLAGYNAGPGAVDRWIKEGKAKNGMLEFIEQIPYKETREYVASIIRNYYWYLKKVDGSRPFQLEYFWQDLEKNGDSR